MTVKIKNKYTGKLPINVDKTVRKLLLKIHPKYYAGLGSIILFDSIARNKNKESCGQYFKKTSSSEARIEIGIERTFYGVPKIFCLFPFVVNYFLSEVLYHELGHHYQELNISIKKKKREKYADQFSLKMQKEALWFSYILFAPMRSLYNYMVKKSLIPPD